MFGLQVARPHVMLSFRKFWWRTTFKQIKLSDKVVTLTKASLPVCAEETPSSKLCGFPRDNPPRSGAAFRVARTHPDLGEQEARRAIQTLPIAAAHSPAPCAGSLPRKQGDGGSAPEGRPGE